MDTYEYKSGPLLECPIYSFGGKCGGEQNLEGWGMETSSNRNASTLYPGGCFYLLDRDNEVLVELVSVVVAFRGLSFNNDSLDKHSKVIRAQRCVHVVFVCLGEPASLHSGICQREKGHRGRKRRHKVSLQSINSPELPPVLALAIP